jgi:D-glycero-D-manno-heptose 1,7-bisphosphate phosphatase
MDRDGTLIKDVGYIKSIEQVQFLEGVIPSLNQIQQLNYKLVVITNQSGIGRGIISQTQSTLVENYFLDQLSLNGINIDGYYYCPHAPWDHCLCRKPSTSLFMQAKNDLDIELENSIMIGDKESDVQSGINLGMKSFLIREMDGSSIDCVGKYIEINHFSKILDYL